MSDFIAYTNDILESAKGFRVRALGEAEGELKQALLRASLLHSCSFLEAHLNYLADHFKTSDLFTLHERATLLEVEVTFDNGQFKLIDKAKFTRMTDRIELLLRKCSTDMNEAKGNWFANLKGALSTRNSIVHPRDVHTLTDGEIADGLRACLDCADALYLAVFKKPLPIVKKGLDGGLAI